MKGVMDCDNESGGHKANIWGQRLLCLPHSSFGGSSARSRHMTSPPLSKMEPASTRPIAPPPPVTVILVSI
jgi:hypothetical protein